MSLDRQIRRSKLKEAIKAGKDPYNAGFKVGYEKGVKDGAEKMLAEVKRELIAQQSNVRTTPAGLVVPRDSGRA